MKNIATAARLIKAEPATMISRSRESSDLGGNYYAFGDILRDEHIILVNNRDVYDNEPVVSGADDWPIAAQIIASSSSSLLKKLVAADRDLVRAS